MAHTTRAGVRDVRAVVPAGGSSSWKLTIPLEAVVDADGVLQVAGRHRVGQEADRTCTRRTDIKNVPEGVLCVFPAQ